MKGRLSFSRSEADEIVALIRQKLKAATDRQKKIRNKIRSIGFYASDFRLRDGYTEQDFLRVVKITPDGSASNKTPALVEEPKLKKRNLKNSDSTVESLSPFADSRSSVLILGTMPGKESLARQFYYCHPRNLFWKLIETGTSEAAPEIFDERREFLLKYGVALWDVCHICIREGSLDANIVNEQPNDLKQFLKRHPSIRAIALNGTRASKLFRQYFSDLSLPTIGLPSSSPANTSVSLETKGLAWLKISEYL